MHLATRDGGMAITRLIDLISCPTKNGAYKAPAVLVLIDHKNIRHVFSSTTFSSSMVPEIDEDSQYSRECSTGTGKAASARRGGRREGRERADTVGQPPSTEIGVPNMPSWKAKKLGKLPREKVLLEL